MKNDEGIILALAKRHKYEIIKKLSPNDFLRLNFTKLNRKAEKLAKVELRNIQEKQTINI